MIVLLIAAAASVVTAAVAAADDDGDTYLSTPHGQDMTQDQFFKRSLTGLNSEFSFS